MPLHQLEAYNLAPGARLLAPDATPFRNLFPRVSTSHHKDLVYGRQSLTTDYFIDDHGQTVPVLDGKAVVTASLLRTLMHYEEHNIIYGDHEANALAYDGLLVQLRRAGRYLIPNGYTVTREEFREIAVDFSMISQVFLPGPLAVELERAWYGDVDPARTALLADPEGVVGIVRHPLEIPMILYKPGPTPAAEIQCVLDYLLLEEPPTPRLEIRTVTRLQVLDPSRFLIIETPSSASFPLAPWVAEGESGTRMLCE